MQSTGRYVRIPTFYGMAFVGTLSLAVADKIKGLVSKPDAELLLLKLFFASILITENFFKPSEQCPISLFLC